MRERSKMLTVEQARARRICRICEQAILSIPSPQGWEFEFGERTYPVPALTLDGIISLVLENEYIQLTSVMSLHTQNV